MINQRLVEIENLNSDLNCRLTNARYEYKKLANAYKQVLIT